MNTRPLVSVVLPVYNTERYVLEAVRSIQEQTLEDWELIIIDDGSTDGSLDIVHSLNDDRVQVIKNETNVGIVKTLNRGLESARGKYIARMDADDISLPHRLERQVQLLEEQTEIAVCGGWARDVDEQGNVIGKRRTRTGEDLNAFFWAPSPIIHPLAMFRSRFNWRYPGDVPHAEDYDLWLNVARTHRLENISEPLLHYRISGQSITSNNLIVQLQSAQFSMSRHSKVALTTKEFRALVHLDFGITPSHRHRVFKSLIRGFGRTYSKVHRRDDLKYIYRWLRRQARLAVSR